MKMNEIKDSYFVTYGIFYSMGVLTFVPHQFFTTSTDYWMHRFRDPLHDDPGPLLPPQNPPSFRPPFIPDLDTRLSRFDESEYAHDRTPLQTTFTSSFVITNQVSKLGFLLVTALFSKRLPPPSKRILGALLSMLVLFLINTAFTGINTDSFQGAFFAITMVLTVLINVSIAVTMISLFELVTKFPLGYFSAILSGQAICGIFSSLVLILVLTVDTSNDPSTPALIFFGVGSLIIFFTTVFYLITKKKSKYFVYCVGQNNNNNAVKEDKWTINLLKLKAAMHKTKWFLGALVFVQGSTSMIHPGLAALVVSDKEYPQGVWGDVYFVPVITFLCFHSADFIGRETARRVKQPRNAFVLMALAILRLGVIPVIMLCNAQPRNNMPVYFGDNIYAMMIILFGFTQGFLVNLCILEVPKVVRKEELEYAAMLVPLFSMIAVAICSAFNMLIITLL